MYNPVSFMFRFCFFSFNYFNHVDRTDFVVMQVLIPILSSQLESAVNAKDVLIIKVCLFSLCTSLMVQSSPASSLICFSTSSTSNKSLFLGLD